MPPTLRERRLGCLLAGAVGDALGAPVERSSWAEIEARFGPAGVTGYADTTGRFTDDTQMTLFLAEGLLRSRAAGAASSREAVRDALLRWLVTQDGPAALPAAVHARIGADGLLEDPRLHARRGPGRTCLASLRRHARALAAGEPPEDPINDRKGCGGVMRSAPAGLLGEPDPYMVAATTCALTHGHPCGYQSGGVLAELLHLLLLGASLFEATADVLTRRRAELHPDLTARLEQAVAMARDPRGSAGPAAVEELGAGWVAEEALAIAVYCALSAPDLPRALLLAVNHSGDSDSTGSLTGNLMGAACGLEAIPAPWREHLEAADLVERVAEDLHTIASSTAT